MRQETFTRSAEPRWERLDAQLAAAEAGEPVDPELPGLYRRVCRDLALARERAFSPLLIDRLNALALRGHRALYGSRGERPRPLAFLLHAFPAAVRRRAGRVAAMHLAFYGTALALCLLDLRDPELVYHFMSADGVEELERMYEPSAPHFGEARDAPGDLTAFAFYLSHNTSIAFRTFASGIFLGLGSLYIVLLNGAYLGLAAGHMAAQGFAGTFFPFVIGHGAFELTAIVLAGVAGFELGMAVLAPGRRSRGAALRRAAGDAVPILYGVIALLALAAAIEATWSGRPEVPAAGKLAVGAALWALTALWLGLGGRRRGA